MSETLQLRGTLEGHSDWVTSIAVSPQNDNRIVTSSRDRSILIWDLTREEDNYGVPLRRLTGHNHFVQDLDLASDGQFALSASWDTTMRLWDLEAGKTTRSFLGHTKDVLSVAFSPDNRQIVSASRDKTIKLWNTLAECKYNLTENGHTNWVSCVKFSPSTEQPLIVSSGWDRVVKIWKVPEFKVRTNLVGHTGYVNTVTVSPDGSLCASGGKDGSAMLWDLNEGRHLSYLESTDIINSLVFSPNRYWLCAATDSGIRIWDLESKEVVEDLTPETAFTEGGEDSTGPACTSLAWSQDGSTLFAGYTDNVIRVWEVTSSA